MGTDPDGLLSLAKAGSGPALSRLLERHRGALEVQARLQVGRRLRAKLDFEDLMQELSLEAHRDITQFRGRSEGEFVSWLRKVFATILSNQVRRYLGTRRRDLRRERRIATGRDDTSRAVIDRRLVAPQSSPSQQASRRERAELLAEALQTLPPAYREVIVLRNLEGLSFSDVAERMGRTEDSVKNIWLRALSRLRRMLGDLL
jgi:RNA polymerase sigma-70 factor (ECF subfamily)